MSQSLLLVHTWLMSGVNMQHACIDMLDTMTIAVQYEYYAPFRAGFWQGCLAIKAMSLAIVVQHPTHLICKVLQLESLMLLRLC